MGTDADLDPVVDPPTDPPVDPPAQDWQAEAEKWKSLARKHERDRKAGDKRFEALGVTPDELEELRRVRQDAMTETEKAVASARTQAFADAMRDVGGRLVTAEAKALLVTKGIADPSAILEVLDTSRFVSDSGDPDTDALGEWIERLSKVFPQGRPAPIDVGGGVKGDGGKEPPLEVQIAEAEKAGNFGRSMQLKALQLASRAGGI